MSSDEKAAALRANVAAYNSLDERTYINGAPHLKHSSVGAIYRSLVDAAIDAIGRVPEKISVLELGAGSGLATLPWFERRVQLTAVDSSEPMLRSLSARAAAYGLKHTEVVSDALDFLTSTDATFDVITHVSMLHHVPDYMDLLTRSAAHVSNGGCLLTFQDPLRYDRMPFGHHFADRAGYFLWRAGQGNVKRGLKTRWRRLRGIYSPSEVVDFDEYHVVRGGVDSAAIIGLLEKSFADVRAVSYWSTYSGLLQTLGQRLHLVSSFGVLASGRKSS
jgi:2-polyprenyl-3-methyl-5-hydroxy-6-metoxy-1,4-benzoquinol methylase